MASRETETEIGKGDKGREKEREGERESATENLGAKEIEGIVTFFNKILMELHIPLCCASLSGALLKNIK